MKSPFIQIFLVFLGSALLTACKKDPPVVMKSNNAPYYDKIPTVIVENYVNRIFIDLIGREPLDVEMDAEVTKLKGALLSIPARESLILKLQTDTAYLPGDSSYRFAYYNRLYELGKARLLEGASDDYIGQQIGILKFQALVDSVNGDSLGLAGSKGVINKMKAVIDIQRQWRYKQIDVNTVYSRLLDNAIYDMINMNSFNFVRASFNDLFARFPIQSEFDAGFFMIESDKAGLLFGVSGKNKGDYIQILTQSNEFYEGMIRWAYITLLARAPSTAEVYNAMLSFRSNKDIELLMRNIIKTDEYANFK
jgi:hypothetical protein